jgi:hypothetical protein
VGVSECEDIIAHDEFDGVDERRDGDCGEQVFVSSEVSGDFS